MENFEKISFLIKQGGFKFVGIEDGFTNHLVYLECNNETELIEKIQLFLSNWGQQKYIFGFRVSKNGAKTTTVQYSNLDIAEPITQPAQQMQPQNLNGSLNLNAEQLEEKIVKRLVEFQKEQDLKRREEAVKEKEKDLDNGGFKIEHLIKNHIMPYFMGGAKTVTNETYIAPMQGQPKAIFTNPYNAAKKEVIDEPQSEVLEISEEDAPKVTEAFQIFCKYMTPDTMLQFAKKIDYQPEIVEQLKAMLNY